MVKFKTIVENVTLVVPIYRSVSAIVRCIKNIYAFNTMSQEVISARNEIVQQMKGIKEILESLNDFNRVNGE